MYVGCRIDDETKQWLEQFCARENVSIAKLLAALIDDFKKEQEKQPPSDVSTENEP